MKIYNTGDVIIQNSDWCITSFGLINMITRKSQDML
jgi:hypothetical protein